MKMSSINAQGIVRLSTHTGKKCSECDSEFFLLEPSEILASCPMSIELTCPSHGCEGQISLHGDEIFECILPQLMDLTESVGPENDNAWLTSRAPTGDVLPSLPPTLH